MDDSDKLYFLCFTLKDSELNTIQNCGPILPLTFSEQLNPLFGYKNEFWLPFFNPILTLMIHIFTYTPKGSLPKEYTLKHIGFSAINLFTDP